MAAPTSNPSLSALRLAVQRRAQQWHASSKERKGGSPRGPIWTHLARLASSLALHTIAPMSTHALPPPPQQSTYTHGDLIDVGQPPSTLGCGSEMPHRWMYRDEGCDLAARLPLLRVDERYAAGASREEVKAGRGGSTNATGIGAHPEEQYGGDDKVILVIIQVPVSRKGLGIPRDPFAKFSGYPYWASNGSCLPQEFIPGAVRHHSDQLLPLDRAR
ncbi:hypothetical protein B0H14DRAFT_2656076 [Mycena olivaceomarginata]|nr:hypothetical protein B0H14DRAFT_2656076 [Mycena olivaceomarginata]